MGSMVLDGAFAEDWRNLKIKCDDHQQRMTNSSTFAVARGAGCPAAKDELEAAEEGEPGASSGSGGQRQAGRRTRLRGVR